MLGVVGYRISKAETKSSGGSHSAGRIFDKEALVLFTQRKGEKFPSGKQKLALQKWSAFDPTITLIAVCPTEMHLPKDLLAFFPKRK